MAEQNSQILEKAIQKASENGWEYVDLAINAENDSELWGLLLHKDFAKAIWGEPKPMTTEEARASGYIGGGGQLCTPRNAGWKYHLQKMVIADDPIKYLGDYLDGRKES